MGWSRKRREDRACSIADCPGAFYAQDLCKRHYYRKKRLGDPKAFVQAHSYDKYNDKGERWCSRHKDWLPVSSFSGKKTWCRDCIRFARYGLGPEQYTKFLQANGGLCQLCRKRKATVVDHDHSCCPGKQTCGECLRGFICHPCNVAIGTLTDEGVKRAAVYLEGEAA